MSDNRALVILGISIFGLHCLMCIVGMILIFIGG